MRSGLRSRNTGPPGRVAVAAPTPTSRGPQNSPAARASVAGCLTRRSRSNRPAHAGLSFCADSKMEKDYLLLCLP
jgi:hypothetical protein